MRDPESASILVIDDEPALCRALVRALLQAGYLHAEGETTEHAAIKRLLMRSADLVILDITLGWANGFPDGCTLGQAILHRWPTTRLLFLSGWDRASLPIACPSDIPLVAKPPNLQVFLARVAQSLSDPPWSPKDWHRPPRSLEGGT